MSGQTFSGLLTICAGNSPVTGEFTHKGQWRGALMSSLIYAWIHGWGNNGDASNVLYMYMTGMRHLYSLALEGIENFNCVFFKLVLGNGILNTFC